MKNKTWLNKIMWGREGEEEERRGRKQTKTKKKSIYKTKNTQNCIKVRRGVKEFKMCFRIK